MTNETIKIETKYPEYITFAVDWWAKAIISPTFNCGMLLPNTLLERMINSIKEYTMEEIQIFKDNLAQEIEENIKKNGFLNLYVGFNPCEILKKVGKIIGVSEWPWKTYMYITTNEIHVSCGAGAPQVKIWSSTSE